jgi:hypothetical protein
LTRLKSGIQTALRRKEAPFVNVETPFVFSKSCATGVPFLWRVSFQVVGRWVAKTHFPGCFFIGEVSPTPFNYCNETGNDTHDIKD